ncbi:hypothetical protein D3C76_1172630 [compost metagenome]
MMRQPFEIDALNVLSDQYRFPAAGTAANQYHWFLYLFNGGLNRRLTQSFIAACDQRVIDPGFF